MRVGEPPTMESVMAIPMTIEEQILYWLSLDLQVRALAERLLQRFAVTVGDLPASAAHHHAEPGGLYRCYEQVGQSRRTGKRVRLWLICGCSIQTTLAPNRDWFSAQRSCAKWAYRTRSSRPLQNLTRRIPSIR